MIPHITTTALTRDRARQIRDLIRKGIIGYGGNRKLKIYGTLHCSSGKRMLPANRVFFTSEAEALAAGYRPCGHCMKTAYQSRKTQQQHGPAI